MIRLRNTSFSIPWVYLSVEEIQGIRGVRFRSQPLVVLNEVIVEERLTQEKANTKEEEFHRAEVMITDAAFGDEREDDQYSNNICRRGPLRK